MIVTKQNHLYVTDAIANVTNTPKHEVSWGADTNENLVLFNPNSADISAIEAEIPNVKTTINLAELRSERNVKLAETDWWASSDLTLDSDRRVYRQALRDITDTYGSLDSAEGNWPTKPE